MGYETMGPEVYAEVPFFQPEGFSLETWNKRYQLHDGETWMEGGMRTATHVAAAETGEEMVRWRDEFFAVIARNLFMPGGRIWYGSGRPKGQLLNCFVAPTADSREGWGKTFYDETVICGTGGGLGLNFTPVRPRGSVIAGHKGTATGAVSEMECVDAIGERLKAGGGRRTALMLCLGIAHGDIMEFLDKKLDLKQLQNANVSVVFDDDPEAFFRLVRAEAELELKFRGRVVGKVPAKTLWTKVVTNALKNGEPGVLNGFLANRMSNTWYLYPLIASNPCGEIWLPAYGCCDLGSLVLPRFVRMGAPGTRSTVNWELLRRVVWTGVRFLDDVLTVNNYPLPEIREVCTGERRIGLGVTGLHDMLLMLGQRYNSPEGLETVNDVIRFIKEEAYLASVDLAKEKGPFPKFAAEPFLKSGFMKTMKPTIRAAVRQYGVRNCALLTMAPVGTTSIACGNVSSGVETIFAPAYVRRWRDGDVLKDEVVIHPLFKRFMEEGRDVSHFQGAHDISMRDHLEMQRACQRHVDNAISKTLNVPPGTSVEELSELYMEFLPDLKGVTVYPDGSRENQPLTPLSLEEAQERAWQAVLGSASNDGCRTGACDI